MELLPDNANLRFNLGVTRMRLDQPARALVDFATVLAETPDDPEAHNNMAVAQFLTGDAAGRRGFPRARARPAAQLPQRGAEPVRHRPRAQRRRDAPSRRCEAYLARFQDAGVLRRLLVLLDAQARQALEQAIPQAEALIQATAPTRRRRHLGRLLEARQALA